MKEIDNLLDYYLEIDGCMNELEKKIDSILYNSLYTLLFWENYWDLENELYNELKIILEEL